MSTKFSREVEKNGAVMGSNQLTNDPSKNSSQTQLPPSVSGLNLPPSSSGRTTGTRSVSSASNVSSIPPPPETTTLQRAGYLRTAPGAQQHPGILEPDDGTIIIGEGQSGVMAESSHSHHGLISARRIDSQEPITAPVHRIHERDYEAASAPNNAQHLLQKPTVKAEPVTEGEKPKPFWKDWKVMCCILFLFVLAIGLGVGFAIGLDKSSNVTSSLSATTNPPTQVMISSAPSSSPTLEFGPPNEATCETVGEGLDVEDQEFMTETWFSLDLDVIVVDQVQTIVPFLDEIEFLLQQEIAPQIAQCYNNRRQLERRRSLLDRFVVGNAIFESVVLSNSVCASSTTENCFPILATLSIFLKDDEPDSALIAHILDIFSESWVLDLPFKSIQLTGARLYTDEVVSRPTFAPSYEEDEYEEEHSR